MAVQLGYFDVDGLERTSRRSDRAKGGRPPYDGAPHRSMAAVGSPTRC